MGNWRVSARACRPGPTCGRWRTRWGNSSEWAPTSAALRRTGVGEFTEADARTLEQLEAAAASDEPEKFLIHLRRILPTFPSVTADEMNVNRIRHGQAVNLPEMSRAPLVKVFAGQAELIAIASRVAGTLFHPKVVLVG